ncbi:MAG: COX15/CtaA family protein [Verrucomicrobiota bacterium]|jgi:cytochrome c oxidase assembly protein subunit 15
MSPLLTKSWNPRLSGFALLTALATLGLLAAGGLVTSHGAGMAVPDWPNTYGYNMFFFPFSQWVGGVFYEHTHRLFASLVGLLTSVLALWLYGAKARPWMRNFGLVLLAAALGALIAWPRRWSDALVLGLTGAALFGSSFAWPRCGPSPRWLRRLGLAAFLAVVLQGVLGGLRVVLFQDEIGIFHATLAQLFFVLVCALALFTSRWWQEAATAPSLLGSPFPLTPALSPSDGEREQQGPDLDHSHTAGFVHRLAAILPLPKGEGRGEGEQDARNAADAQVQIPVHARSLPSLVVATTLLILVQLILGAWMRHQHAGLAIPDFPLAYGKLWPHTDAAAVALYNQQRLETVSLNPITAFQIGLQMAHRILAALILAAVAACAWQTWRRLGARSALGKLGLVWLGLVLTQALLGALTIWSDKAADIATAHVLGGALSLALGTIQCLLWVQQPMPARRTLAPALDRRSKVPGRRCRVSSVEGTKCRPSTLDPRPSATSRQFSRPMP